MSLHEQDTGAGFGLLGESVGGQGVVGQTIDGSGVRGISSSNAGVEGYSDIGDGVYGTSKGHAGVYGEALSENAYGVSGKSDEAVAIFGESKVDNAILGVSTGRERAGVFGLHQGPQGFGIVGISEIEGGAGVRGHAEGGLGVVGSSYSQQGVSGTSTRRAGVSGQSERGNGVVGYAQSVKTSGVHGTNNVHGGFGVTGQGVDGVGVLGETTSGSGVMGKSRDGEGVAGLSQNGPGLKAESQSNDGVYGLTFGSKKSGVHGYSSAADGYGVFGENNKGTALHGSSATGFGLHATSYGKTALKSDGLGGNSTGAEIFGMMTGIQAVGIGKVGLVVTTFGQLDPNDQTAGAAVHAQNSTPAAVGVRALVGSGRAIHAIAVHPTQPYTYAGMFEGDVRVYGTLRKNADHFQIDHPLDPENRYLEHCAIESNEMKNVYDGTVILDENGQGLVTLPEWFDALNENFRYQLTPIGSPAPDLHIASEIDAGSFKIAGGRASLKVCWQVTGTRRDPWAQAHPMQVEIEKLEAERGYYIYPELYNQPVERGLSYARNGDLKGHIERVNSELEQLRNQSTAEMTEPPHKAWPETPDVPEIPELPIQPQYRILR